MIWQKQMKIDQFKIDHVYFSYSLNIVYVYLSTSFQNNMEQHKIVDWGQIALGWVTQVVLSTCCCSDSVVVNRQSWVPVNIMCALALVGLGPCFRFELLSVDPWVAWEW